MSLGFTSFFHTGLIPKAAEKPTIAPDAFAGLDAMKQRLEAEQSQPGTQEGQTSQPLEAGGYT